VNYQPRPLREDEQRDFQANVLSFVGEIRAAKRQTGRIAWFACIGFSVFGLAGMASYVRLLPYLQERIDVHWVKVDEMHGYISEAVAATDAPKLFSEATNEHWVKTYIMLVMDYVPQTDRSHYTLAQVLSGIDQRARYVEWHDKDPQAPRQKLKKAGSVETDHYVFYPKGKTTDNGVDTFEYYVTFNRRETSEGTSGAWEAWGADIQFQWHPELVRTSEQVTDNPGGMVVLYFRANKP